MIIYKPENCTDESQTIYICDQCGNPSNFTDHWWPGCYHWADRNYTLCSDCLPGVGIHYKVVNNGDKSPEG